MFVNHEEYEKLQDIINAELKGTILNLRLNTSFFGLMITPAFELEPNYIIGVEKHQSPECCLRNSIRELVKRYKKLCSVQDYFDKSSVSYNDSELAVALMTDEKIELYHHYHNTVAITLVIENGRYILKPYNYYKKEIECKNIDDLKGSIMHYTRDFYLSRFQYLIEHSVGSGASVELIRSVIDTGFKRLEAKGGSNENIID